MHTHKLRKNKIVNIGFQHFWDGFTLKTFQNRHPYLLLKYQFIESLNPDYLFTSKFNRGEKRIISTDACNIFYTGENIEPDLNTFDFAISFSLIKHASHFRLPCWVPRLRENGMQPNILLDRNRASYNLDLIPSEFCNFIFMNKVEYREQFFHALNSRMAVTAPGQSCNNAPSIGKKVADKISFQKKFRFSIAFENERHLGYTTEKIIESFPSGTVPIYCGDPNIMNEFNCNSFININSSNNFNTCIEKILHLEKNKNEYLEIKNATIYKENTLPDHANEENIMAFFESIFN